MNQWRDETAPPALGRSSTRPPVRARPRPRRILERPQHQDFVRGFLDLNCIVVPEVD
jgi:hypothetical protein